MSQNQIFLGALVLDKSNHTDMDRVVEFLEVIRKPFREVMTCNLFDLAQYADSAEPATGEITSGFMQIASTLPSANIHVPSKAACVHSWLRGTVTNMGDINRFYVDTSFKAHGTDTYDDQQFANGKMLLRINSAKHQDTEPVKNYAELVKTRVTKMVQGQWVATTFFAGPRPTITLSCRYQQLYLSVVTIDSALILTWSTEMEAVQQILNATLPVDHVLRSLVWVSPVMDIAVFDGTDTLVIHPMFLLTKVRKWTLKHEGDLRRVIITLEEHLRRISV